MSSSASRAQFGTLTARSAAALRSAGPVGSPSYVVRDNAIIVKMQPINIRGPQPNWLTSVLTDIHFWVPIAVLFGGLLLLESIH
jgi:hypothetical protein